LSCAHASIPIVRESSKPRRTSALTVAFGGGPVTRGEAELTEAVQRLTVHGIDREHGAIAAVGFGAAPQLGQCERAQAEPGCVARMVTEIGLDQRQRARRIVRVHRRDDRALGTRRPVGTRRRQEVRLPERDRLADDRPRAVVVLHRVEGVGLAAGEELRPGRGGVHHPLP
jgi:hypothetical protein